jgi:long-chain acyl-CoA synthetase
MNLAMLAERNVERFGEYDAINFEDRWHTNAEQLAAAYRFAGVLSGLGLGPDDPVAVMMPNRIEVYQAYAGITAAGGVVVPVLFLLAVPEVNHILADARPKVVLTTPEFFWNLRSAMDGLADPPIVLVTGTDAPEGALALETLAAQGDPAYRLVDREDDDLAVIMYTGGTTGRPKGVMITHGSLLWMAGTLARTADVGHDDVGLMALPVSHLFGMITGITGQVLGTRGVLLRWFTPEDVLGGIQHHRVTYLPMVPTMARYLLQHPDVGRFDTSSLKTILLSAAPVPSDVKEGLAGRFRCEVLEAYGLTEASPAIAMERRGGEKRAGSCGRPLDGVEVAILDDAGAPLPPGEVGEICARSPGVMKGYFNLPDASAGALEGGWLHTGDLGYLDQDGYLYVTDRKKDMIIRGGFNVYPRDVEVVLHQHPTVAEAAVVVMPDPIYAEEVIAFVVPTAEVPPSEEELLEFCRRRLARYKAPKEIRFVGFLPKSPIGKVLKKDLRAQLAVETGPGRREGLPPG